MLIQAHAAMKAKDKLSPFSYEIDKLNPYEVLIEISHCGICYSDIHLINDDWKKSVFPLVPGHEVVGRVIKSGSLCKEQIGIRAGVSWLYGSCLTCPTCLSGETQICPTKQALCIGHHGGFAKHVIADSRFIYKIPDKIDSASAAPLLCAGATVFAPFKRFKIQASDKIAILGIGGLGHLALQYGRAFGCDVTAISSSEDKKNEAHEFGANNFVYINNLVQNELNLSNSFDYILSTIHGNLDWDLICSLLKPTGVLCILGKPSKNIELCPTTSLSAQRIITSSSVANRLTIQEMLTFSEKKNIRPKIELFKIENINEAIQKVKENKARYRVVLEI